MKSWHDVEATGNTDTFTVSRYGRNSVYISIITRDGDGKLTDARNMMTMPYDVLKKMVLEV